MSEEDSVRVDPSDTDTTFMIHQREPNDTEFLTPPCIVCGTDFPETLLKCCTKTLCFKCYNGMARSGRTIRCPHCRSNPLLFFDGEESEAQPEPQVPVQHRFTFEETPNFPLRFSGQNTLEPPLPLLFFRPLPQESQLCRKKVFAVRTLFLIFQTLFYYLTPMKFTICFYVGFVLGNIDFLSVSKFILYPLVYFAYLYRDIFKPSILWRYFLKLDILEDHMPPPRLIF